MRDLIIRPKAEAELVERAMKALGNVEGVRPSALIPSLLQSPPPPPQEEKSQEQESEQLARPPSLTAVSRMNKGVLLRVGLDFGIEDLHETDTVPILKRKVKSWIKQNA